MVDFKRKLLKNSIEIFIEDFLDADMIYERRLFLNFYIEGENVQTLGQLIRNYTLLRKSIIISKMDVKDYMVDIDKELIGAQSYFPDKFRESIYIEEGYIKDVYKSKPIIEYYFLPFYAKLIAKNIYEYDMKQKENENLLSFFSGYYDWVIQYFVEKERKKHKKI